MTSEEPGAGRKDEGGVVRRERFSGGPARGFLSSLAADERIFAADLAVDRAHVVMLAEQDVLTDAIAGKILAALDDIEDIGHDELPDGEDVHEAIETDVIERVGLDGGRMHTARSRNDEVATCIRYRLREDLLDAIEATLDARATLLDTAAEEAETIMPGFTHLQPAQPTTVAHWALSYERALARETARLVAAYDRTNQSPLGAAAFAGTPFDIDRDRTAELLGFETTMANAMDAVSARDFLVETVATLATLATTLSGLAEDVVIYANKGYVEVDDAYASTSSIMPQKKNPDTLELVRARAGDASAGLTGLLTTLKGLPRSYNRDLQRAGGHAWRAIDGVSEAVEVAAGVIATADWNDDVLAAAAGEGFSTATGVADALAMAGVPFRTAHEVVASAAETAGDTVTVEDLEAAAEGPLGDPLRTYVDRETIEAALDPTASVASRDSPGGPAPGAVAAQRSRAREDYDRDQAALEDRQETLEAAAAELESEVGSYV